MPDIVIDSGSSDSSTSSGDGPEYFTLYKAFIPVKRAGEIIIAKVRPSCPISYISKTCSQIANLMIRASQKPLAEGYEVHGFEMMDIEITPDIYIKMEMPVIDSLDTGLFLGRDFLDKVHISRARYVPNRGALNLDYLIAHWHQEGKYLSIPAILNVKRSQIRENPILHDATPMHDHELTEEQALALKEISYAPARSETPVFRRVKPQLTILFYQSSDTMQAAIARAAGGSSSRSETSLQQPAPSSRSTHRRPIERLSIEEDETRSESYGFYQVINRILDEFRWRNLGVAEKITFLLTLAAGFVLLCLWIVFPYLPMLIGK